MPEHPGEFRVLGPPGTGKTRFLEDELAYDAQTYGEAAVVAISHTRAAAAEIARRVTDIPEDNVGTIHAMAYRAIGRPTLVETNKDLLSQFAEANPRYPMSANASVEDLESGVQLRCAGDAALAEYGRLRNALVPEVAWPAEVRAFAGEWEAFKRETGTVDFTDMLSLALADADCAPGDPAALIVDETQDCSRLQMELLWSWASKAQRVVFALDADQSIYGFSGADPTVFLERPAKAEHVLEQSFRVPRAVHAYALSVIRRVQKRKDVEYKPTPDEGAVHRIAQSWQEPEPILRAIEALLGDGQRIMVMASCSYMLEPMLRLLRERLIPFSNPWRKKRGDWNPLLRRGKGTTVEALRDFLTLYRTDAKRSFWTRDQLLRWSALTKGVYKRSGRKTVELLEEGADEQQVLQALLAVLQDPDDFDALMAAMPRPLEWLRSKLNASKRVRAEYLIDMIDARGEDVFDEEPRLHVGTIHSFKGTECDAVFVWPDLSFSAFYDYQCDPDAAHRLYYVAVTRAKREVYLCRPSTPCAVPW